MPNEIIVEFRPLHHKKLVDALKEVDTQVKKVTSKTGTLTKETKKSTKASGLFDTRNKRNAKTMSDLGNSFSTVRSKLLLVNFAMAMGTRQLIQFGKEAAKVDSMSRAFTTLSGGAQNASVAINKLGKATNGTMSDFDLFQQANNAMILGVSNNSDEMAKMFDMAQRLGSALGKDTRMSVESLITGIGRQSRLMLDNIGIIVKADKAYSDYATELGKTAATLTDSEKKQAFMNATLEAARDKIAGLPEEILTADQKFQQFGASIDNLKVSIGEAFLPLLESMATILTVIADAFNSDRVLAYAQAVGIVLVGALIRYRQAVMKAVSAQMKLGWGALIVGAGILAESIYAMSGAFEDAEQPVEDLAAANMTYLQTLGAMKKVQLAEELKKQQLAYKGLSPELVKVNEAIDHYQAKLAAGITQETVQHGKIKMKINIEDQLAAAQEKKAFLLAHSITLTDKEKESIELNITTLKEQLDIMEHGFDTYKQFEESIAIVDKMYLQTLESQLAVNQGHQDMVNKLIDEEKATTNNAEVLTQYNAVLEFLTNQRIGLNKKEGKSEFDLAQSKKKTYSMALSAMGDLVGMSEKNAKAAAAIHASAAIVDAYVGAQKAWRNTLDAGLITPFPEIAWAAALATGLVNARQVAMAANDIGGGSSGATTPLFQEGGYVGGRRHSQGGTIIEAEQGEFVMSRNAVESIGIETLNRMNLEGGGGGVNITVTGNVLTQDYVEGELAESIKEALRRGSDFGIS